MLPTDKEGFEGRIETAEAFEQAGQLDEAIVQWASLAAESGDPAFYCRLGRAALELGRLDQARCAFEDAVSRDEQCALARAKLALISLREDRLDEAEAHISRAIRDDKNASTLCILGAIQVRQCRTSDAKKTFEAAVALDPNYEEAYYNLGLLNRDVRDLSTAQRHLSTAIDLNARYSEAHRELGWVLSELGEAESAEYHVRRAIELTPDDGWAHVYLGNILWKSRDREGAELEFRTAVQVSPNESFPYWALANLYENERMWDKAASSYEKAIEANDEDEIAHKNLGRMLLKRGDLVRAKAELEKAVRIDPHYQAALNLLAEIESTQKG